MDRYDEFGVSATNAAYLKFDDALAIDGVFAESTKIDFDIDKYKLVDVAPGNYDFALSGGTDTSLYLHAYDAEDGLSPGHFVAKDEDHLQIQLLETVSLLVGVVGDAGSGEYRLTIGSTWTEFNSAHAIRCRSPSRRTMAG